MQNCAKNKPREPELCKFSKKRSLESRNCANSRKREASSARPVEKLEKSYKMLENSKNLGPQKSGSREHF
jgi:hypothetical protein